MEKQNLTDALNSPITSFYVAMGLMGTFFVVKIGNKIAKYVIRAVTSQYNTEQSEAIVAKVLEIVNPKLAKIEQSIDKMEKKNHGLVQKNEGVLSEALDFIKALRIINETKKRK